MPTENKLISHEINFRKNCQPNFNHRIESRDACSSSQTFIHLYSLHQYFRCSMNDALKSAQNDVQQTATIMGIQEEQVNCIAVTLQV